MSLPIGNDYQNILIGLKEKIRQARLKATISVNAELLKLYWEMGQTILQQQKEQGWGAKIIDRLAIDLKVEFTDFKGLSVRNLKYMRAFAEAYPQFGIVHTLPVNAEGAELQEFVIVQQLAAQLPWGHHQVLMNKAKDVDQRLFYMQKCVENGWSRNILSEQIEGNLYERQGMALSNFKQTLPSVQSDLAQQTLKNPYVFDFLSLGEEMKERDLEKGLIQHLKKFMLELGKGFAYVGNQYNLNVDGNDYFLDLLFYNTHLRCYVLFELKLGEFKPEYAGKLNFYINTVDAQIKDERDQHTIGVLLCRTPNETVVKYALQGITTPMGVSEYQLAEALPKQLKAEMPSVEELEKELEKEIEELKRPVEKRFDILKQKLSDINTPEFHTPVSLEILRKVFDEGLFPLFTELMRRLEEFHSLFISHNFFWSGDNNISSLDKLGEQWKNEEYLKKNTELHFVYRLNGLKKGGVDTFDIIIQMNYYPSAYRYAFSLVNYNNQQPFLKKLYHEMLTKEDIQFLCDTVCNDVIDQIERRIQFLNQEKNGR